MGRPKTLTVKHRHAIFVDRNHPGHPFHLSRIPVIGIDPLHIGQDGLGFGELTLVHQTGRLVVGPFQVGCLVGLVVCTVTGRKIQVNAQSLQVTVKPLGLDKGKNRIRQLSLPVQSVKLEQQSIEVLLTRTLEAGSGLNQGGLGAQCPHVLKGGLFVQTCGSHFVALGRPFAGRLASE